MIVKVQLPLASSGDEPAPALVYDQTRGWRATLPVTPALLTKMNGRVKAFFHAERDLRGDVTLGVEARWQDW